MINDVDTKLVENSLEQQPKKRLHVMDVLVVVRRWLLKSVKLWEPEFLKKQSSNLAIVPNFTNPG
jgi:hypothetical protein